MRRSWRAGFLALALIAVIGGAVEKGWNVFSADREKGFMIQGADDSGYFYWLRSWVVDRDVHFENDIRLTPSLPLRARENRIAARRLDNGYIANKYFCGWAVLNLPPFLAVHAVARATGAFPADGIAPPYILAVWIWQIALGAAGLRLAYGCLRHWFRPVHAELALWLGFLASPLTYYFGARVSMVHAVVFFLVALVFTFSIQLGRAGRADRPAPWLGLGLAAGLLVLTRPTGVVYLLFPALAAGRALVDAPGNARRRRLVLAGIGALLALAVLALQWLFWLRIYGRPLVWTYRGEGFNWLSPQLWGSLFSDYHGLFNWHPYLLVGAVGFVFWTLRAPQAPKSMLLSLAGIIYLNSAWHMWHFGSSFGGRAYEAAVFLFMAGLAWLFQQTEDRPPQRLALLGPGLLFAAWNVTFQFLFQANRIPRESPVSWIERLQTLLPGS